MKTSQPQASLGRLLFIGSAVAWSFAGTFTMGVKADVWMVLFWRGLLAAGVMLAYLAWRHGPSAITDATKLGAPGWVTATVGSVATICFIAALKNTAIANFGIIYATAPFAAAGIGWLVMRERPALATMVAAGFCLLGVVVMLGGAAGAPNLTGDMLAIATTVLMATMMVIMRRWLDRLMTLAVGPVSSLQLVAVGWAMTNPWNVLLEELLPLVGFGLAHAAALIMLVEGVLRIKASEAGLLGALEMPLVPLWGRLFLSEIPGVPTFVGGAIVMVTLGWNLASSQRGASS